MNIREIHGNINRTLGDMRRQVGIRPGGNTGLCNPVVVGSLTGSKMDFSVCYINTKGQGEMNTAAGLQRHDVAMPEELGPSGALLVLLDPEQMHLGLDAVLIHGKIRGSGRPHLAAVAPNEGNTPFTVIDSQLRRARLVTASLTDIAEYVDKRFMDGSYDLSIVPDATERPRMHTRTLDDLTIGRNADVFIIGTPST